MEPTQLQMEREQLQLRLERQLNNIPTSRDIAFQNINGVQVRDIIGNNSSNGNEINENSGDNMNDINGNNGSDSDDSEPPQSLLAVPNDRFIGGRFNDRANDEANGRFNDTSPLLNTRATQNQPNQPFEDIVHNLTLRERALTFYKSVRESELDSTFEGFYGYFVGKGFVSITLAKAANLIILAFIVSFSTFIFGCIDHSKIKSHKLLSDALVPNCLVSLPVLPTLFIFLFTIWWLYQTAQLLFSIPHLYNLHAFFTQLLKIQDSDLPTVSWNEISNRIISLQKVPETCLLIPGSMNLDVHKIANRIMRRENYWIALYNKDILDLAFPFPMPFITGRPCLTKIMEFNLRVCIGNLLFQESGEGIRPEVLMVEQRAVLIHGLKRRLALMAILNMILSPFILGMTIMYLFFRYAQELHSNPRILGSRRYSSLAKWKFRDFNELPHLFQQRLNRSYRKAQLYVSQFSSPKTTILARLVAFIAGAFASFLAIFLVFEEDFDLGFQITSGKSVGFYITVFGAIFAVARGLVPDENLVLEPEMLLLEWSDDTHYLPHEWKGKLHSEQVKLQFSGFFSYRFVLLTEEILSVLYAPFILLFSLPPCSERIIDFFRDHTKTIAAMGPICDYADFDLRRNGDREYGAPADATVEEWHKSKYGKMEQSFVNFTIHYPEWNPAADDGGNRVSRAPGLSPTGAGAKTDTGIAVGAGVGGDKTGRKQYWDRITELGQRAGVAPEMLRRPRANSSRTRRHPRRSTMLNSAWDVQQGDERGTYNGGGGMFSLMNDDQML